MGHARSCPGISVEDETVGPKSMHGIVLPFHTPRVINLQSLE